MSLLFLVVNYSFACDVCSCGASNNNGFSSAMKGHYIGLTYNYMHFTYKEGIVANSPTANDYINTVNITGQYQVSDNLQLTTIIPYRFNTRNTSTGNVKNDGIGDVVLYGFYTFLTKSTKHKLKVGTGLKLPTGEFNIQQATVIGNQTSSIQLGTGSLDIILPIQYGYKIKDDLDLSLGVNYFIKNKNEEDFKYGNQTQINTSLSYKISLKEDNLLIPKIGFNYDHFLPTERFDVVDNRTSGYVANTSFGVETRLNEYVMGINYQLPVAQNLIDNEVSFKKGIGVYGYYRF